MREKSARTACASVAHGERLREAGHAFEQDVAVGEEADQEAVDEVLLTDDDPGDLLAEARHPGAGGVDGGGHRGGEGARAGRRVRRFSARCQRPVSPDLSLN
jgi:hypothetical protein